MYKKERILIVDDEHLIQDLLKRILEKENYDLEFANNGEEALKLAGIKEYNLLIIDYKMPGFSGLEVLRKIKENNPYIEVILMTGYATIDLAIETIKIGAFDFICKPFDVNNIREVVKRCLGKQKFYSNNIKLTELETLFDISRPVCKPENLDSVLEKIVNAALDITKAVNVSILVFDDKTKKMDVRMSKGLDKNAILEVKKIIDNNIKSGIWGVIFDGDKGNSVSRLNKYKTNSSNAEFFNDKFIINIPLYSEEELIGSFIVSSDLFNEGFSEREQALLSVLAGITAKAIKNSQLYEQLQHKIRALEKNVRELNETRNQLVQTEKLAAVGNLAFGIAHEIRNPLAIILEGVEFIKNNLGNEDRTAEMAIEKIKKAVYRANNIIVDLLKFSRSSKLKFEKVNICLVLDEVIDLVKNQANLKNIEINKDFFDNEVIIQADPNMLRQAFFNICINAVFAMPKGGKLNLKLYRGQDLKQYENSETKEIFIDIEDTGQGISEEIINKIFDPFFTTKETGEGTGLGLSIVHLILEKHNGRISVTSKMNKGTKFTVELSDLNKAKVKP